MADLVAELKEITTKVTAILDRVIAIFAESGEKLDEYTDANNVTWRVYTCPARKALINLAKLSTKGTYGDKDIAVRVRSYLGRNNYEYVTEDGFKFAFAFVSGQDVKIKFKKANAGGPVVTMDTVGDLDLDF